MHMDLTHTLRSDIAGRAGKAGLARKAILVLWAGLLSNLALTATTANAITENKEAYKLYAYVKLINAKEFICLNALWTKESQWSSVARNKKGKGMGRQSARTDTAYAIGSLGFSLGLRPLPASTPPSDPVRKMAKVLRRSIKAASLGACAPIGCVTKIKA